MSKMGNSQELGLLGGLKWAVGARVGFGLWSQRRDHRCLCRHPFGIIRYLHGRAFEVQRGVGVAGRRCTSLHPAIPLILSLPIRHPAFLHPVPELRPIIYHIALPSSDRRHHSRPCRRIRRRRVIVRVVARSLPLHNSRWYPICDPPRRRRSLRGVDLPYGRRLAPMSMRGMLCRGGRGWYSFSG